MSKQITRKYIERVAKRDNRSYSRTGGSGGSGGGSGVSQLWVEENYVSKEFFNRIFEIHDEEDNIITPNDAETTVGDIQAKAGLWSEQFISALGKGDGEGGDVTLNEPLASINAAGLGRPSTANVGIVWNGSRWTYGSTGEGTVTAISIGGTTYQPSASGIITLPDYLPLSGGTMTGSITMPSGRSAFTGSSLNFGSGDTQCRIGSANSGNLGIYAAGSIYIRPNAAESAGSYGLVISDTSFTYNGNAVWHAGNFVLSEYFDTNKSALKAKKLSTTVKLWGQDFDGTGNVSGSLSDVTTISASGNIVIAGTSDSARYVEVGTTNTTVRLEVGKTTNRGVYLPDLSKWLIYTSSAGNTFLPIGNIGIGTDSPTYKLHVAGTFRASGDSSVGGTLSVTGLTTANGGIVIPSGKTLKIGDAVLSWDSTNQAVKITKGFYSETFISALGAGSSGSGGATALSQLTDVALSSPVAGQVLTYRNGKWKNETPQSGGSGTVTAISLGGTTYQPSASGIVTLPDYPSLTGYLPLSGGTLSGTGSGILTIDRNNDRPSYIKFLSNGDLNGYIGVSSDKVPVFHDTSDYHTIWHAGNDGAGSGLDADLLDGHDSSYWFTNDVANKAAADENGRSLVTYKRYSSSFAPNDGQKHWYTVVTYNNNYYTKNAIIQLSTRRTTATLLIDFYNQNTPYVTCLSFSGSPSETYGGFTGGVRVIESGNDGIIQMEFYAPSTTSETYWRLGLKLYAEHPGAWVFPDTLVADDTAYSSPLLDTTVYRNAISTRNVYPIVDEEYNIGSSSMKYKNVYAVNFHGAFDGKATSAATADNATTAASCTGNAATATKLASSVTLWGRSFDGSSNVSGNMTSVGSITMSGAISGATTISASSNVSVGGTLSVTGAATLSSTLVVTGNAKFSGYTGFGYDADTNYRVKVKGVVYASTGVYSAGYVTALSDIRHKDIQGEVGLTVAEIANAPAVRFLWKDRRQEGLQVGSIAQYWQKVLPEAVVEGAGGELTMSYGVIALLASIKTARKVEDLERRVNLLEKENRLLKEQLKVA